MGKRRRNPEWWTRVDRDMRLYLVWERVIKQQENIILTHRLTGPRTTPVYKLREGTPGGPTMYETEKIVMEIDIAEKKIAAGIKYRADLEETIEMAAGGDEDKKIFIYRYWLSTKLPYVSVRTRQVTEALPFLAHREWRTGRPTRPNRNFYIWRENLYVELGSLLGHYSDTGGKEKAGN